MAAGSAKFKNEMNLLSAELYEIIKTQAEIDRVRTEESDIFKKEKPLVERGITGLKAALKILRDYYAKSEDAAHEASEGGASSIIGLLEVAESDMTKQLSEMVAFEAEAKKNYEEQSQENSLAKQAKDQDLGFKTG